MNSSLKVLLNKNLFGVICYFTMSQEILNLYITCRSTNKYIKDFFSECYIENRYCYECKRWIRGGDFCLCVDCDKIATLEECYKNKHKLLCTKHLYQCHYSLIHQSHNVNCEWCVYYCFKCDKKSNDRSQFCKLVLVNCNYEEWKTQSYCNECVVEEIRKYPYAKFKLEHF